MSLRLIIEGVGALLAVLMAGMWVVRRFQSYRASVESRDEIPFERQYDRIEPAPEHQRGLESVGSAITRLHQGWAVLTVPFLVIAAIVAFRSDRLVRVIIAATVTTMFVIAMGWGLRRRMSHSKNVPEPLSADKR